MYLDDKIRFNSVSFRDSRLTFQSMDDMNMGYDPFRRYTMDISIGNLIKDTSWTRILLLFKHGSIRGSLNEADAIILTLKKHEIFGGILILQDHMRCLKYLMVKVELAPFNGQG